ncbi:MAG TPA: hypothetical protein EYG18_06250 [Micavibrio sp.]|nr:hypothetical protein [Micavibrio sp.]HIL28851.1 hypothetical protein [Micavibrio sp.]
MSDIMLKSYQREWPSLGVDSAIMDKDLARYIDQIYRDLESWGHDMDKDATYALIAPDLTAEKFAAYRTRAFIEMTISRYHAAMAPERRYDAWSLGGAVSRHAILQSMAERELPQTEVLIAKFGIPESVPPMTAQTLKMIIGARDDGTLEQDIKQSAMAGAIEEFCLAEALIRQYDAAKETDRTTPRGCLGKAKIVLELLDEAGEYYAPQTVTLMKDNHRDADEAPKAMIFDRQAATDLRDKCLKLLLANDFKVALDFQAQGHFVLDYSGSGHGMMKMPMQSIAEELNKAGADLTDPKTYDALGTDIKTFRACYERERTEVAANDEYNLLKPAFKI